MSKIDKGQINCFVSKVLRQKIAIEYIVQFFTNHYTECLNDTARENTVELKYSPVCMRMVCTWFSSKKDKDIDIIFTIEDEKLGIIRWKFLHDEVDVLHSFQNRLREYLKSTIK